ncbi:MAG: nucleotidyltransferase family protein [Bacteroidales bacterium]
MTKRQENIDLLSEFRIRRGAIYGISGMGVFGSVARGEHTENSDIDVYYEGRPLSLFKTVALKEELEKLLNCSVDIVRLRESMNKILRKRIQEEGIYV